MAFQMVGIGDCHQKSTSHRNAARMKALDQILQEAAQLPALAAWLQVGDVYDSRSTVEDRNTVAGYLVAMAVPPEAPSLNPATRHGQCAKSPFPEVRETLLDGTRYNRRGVHIPCP